MFISEIMKKGRVIMIMKHKVKENISDGWCRHKGLEPRISPPMFTGNVALQVSSGFEEPFLTEASLSWAPRQEWLH